MPQVFHQVCFCIVDDELMISVNHRADKIVEADVVVDAFIVHGIGVDAIAEADVEVEAVDEEDVGVEDNIEWSGRVDDAFVICCFDFVV